MNTKYKLYSSIHLAYTGEKALIKACYGFKPGIPSVYSERMKIKYHSFSRPNKLIYGIISCSKYLTIKENNIRIDGIHLPKGKFCGLSNSESGK